VYIIVENFLSHPQTDRSCWMLLIQLSSSRALLNFNSQHKGAEAGCQLLTLGKEKKKKRKKERQEKKKWPQLQTMILI